MKKVSMPYQTQNGKLTMQTLNWPQRCACCGSENASEQLQIDHQAEMVHDANKVRYYPLSWLVPYCSVCHQHARMIPRLQFLVFGGAALLWVGFGYLLFLWGLAEETVGMVIFLASLALIGFASFRLIKYLRNTIVELTPNCVKDSAAVEVSSMNQQIIFSFHRDEYAADFIMENRPIPTTQEQQSEYQPNPMATPSQ